LALVSWRVVVQVGVRLVLAFAAILGAVELFRLLLLPEIQSAFLLDDSATSLLRRAGILLFALAAYWAYVRLIEKRRVDELRFVPAGIALGAVSGALLISITTLSLFALGIYEVTTVRGLQSGLLGVAGLIFVAAVLEEVVFRGVLFRILETAAGTVHALWLQALIFAVVHLANVEGASLAETVTTLVAGTLIGALWTMVFVYSRNLWVASANHAAWNFAIILTGLPLSGIEEWRALAPFESRYNGPVWLTGGMFGPEDSIVTIAVGTLSLAVLFYLAKRQFRAAEVPETTEARA
jgi:membrane protease YdiL (CAAX protease family)